MNERERIGDGMSDINARNAELDSLRRRLRIEWLRGEWARTFAFDTTGDNAGKRRLELERRLRSLGCMWPGCEIGDEPPAPAHESDTGYPGGVRPEVWP